MVGPGLLVEVSLLKTSFVVFAGIDWAEQSHAVCALVDDRPVHHAFPNTPQGIAAIARWLAQFADSHDQVAVAIEVPHGPVVEGLLLRGFTLFAINPKQLDRHRDRYSLAGAKDDRRDAFVLADSLRLDPASFREVRLPPPAVIQLRTASRLRRGLVRTRVRLTNQLRSQLLECAPHYLTLSTAADDPWFWHLLSLLPAPGASSLSKAKVAAILKRFRITRCSVDEVLAVLRTPALVLAPGTVEACSFVIASTLRRLKPVADDLAHTERHIQGLLAQLDEPTNDGALSDVEILDSYPGAGPVVVAGLLAEAYQPIVDRDLQSLRAQSGSAPVTKRSGKSWFVIRRRAVNPHLQDAAFFLADAAVKRDPWAKDYYHRARARGQNHARALRGLADRILDQLIAMLTTRTLFDPNRRRGRVSPPGLTA